MSVSYKDSMVDMPALQIITPWLTKPAEFAIGEVAELSWSATDHAFFYKIKMLHEQLRSSLLTNHRVKLNSQNFALTIFLDKNRTSIKSADNELVGIENATKNIQQQYKLCIRLAGIHLQHGCANYRFKCIGALLR